MVEPVYVVLYKGNYFDKEHVLRAAMETAYFSEGHTDSFPPDETEWWVYELDNLELVDLNDESFSGDFFAIEDKLGWLL
jgi:hypothetical protein